MLNKPPQQDKRPESERIQDAEGILDILVNRNLIPTYGDFNISELFKELDGQEKAQAFKVADLIEKILLSYSLIRIHPQFNLRYELTQEGRKMMKFEYFMFYLEEINRSISPSAIIDNSIKISGDNNTAITGDENKIQGSFDLDLLSKANPTTDENIQPAKQDKATSLGKFTIKHIWPIILTIATGLIVAYLTYRFHWLS